MDQKTKISKFIQELSSKNYAQANKYLRGVIEDKIKTRINTASEKPLF